MSDVCAMIISPSWEGSPHIECGKPVARAYEGTPCCEDCYRACVEQDERDAAARRATQPGGTDSEGNDAR